MESGRDRQQTLERCVHRWEFDREKKAKKEQTLAAADADRVAFRSIDWHDFVVVEVIFFIFFILFIFLPVSSFPPLPLFYSCFFFFGGLAKIKLKLELTTLPRSRLFYPRCFFFFLLHHVYF